MSRRMAFLHLPPIRWLTSFYNPPNKILPLFKKELEEEFRISGKNFLEEYTWQIARNNLNEFSDVD